MSNDIKSVLNLEKLVFDNISFKRQGFKSESELDCSIASTFSKNSNEELYRVTLKVQGDKPNEYTFEIQLSGYFTFESEGKLTEEEKKLLLSQNAIAIIMPYMRSEISLLTAQPETDCVVLPPFNISKFLNDD